MAFILGTAEIGGCYPGRNQISVLKPKLTTHAGIYLAFYFSLTNDLPLRWGK